MVFACRPFLLRCLLVGLKEEDVPAVSSEQQICLGFVLCFFFFFKENDELGGWKRQLNLFKMISLMKVSSRGIVGQVDSNRFRKTEPVI